MKVSQGRYAIGWQRCSSLPLARERFVQAGQRRGKGVALGPEQVEITERSSPALRECADSKTVLLQHCEHFSSEPIVAGMVSVSGEREHDLACRSGCLILRS